jgi:hypothetical protein
MSESFTYGSVWGAGSNPGPYPETSGDGWYLGCGDGGDQTHPQGYIRGTRGGYTTGNWISGISDHDGTPDAGRTYTKHFMGMSDVIAAAPPGTLIIIQ